MPTLPDMLLPHAQSHARADLVAGNGGRQKLAAAYAAELRNGHQRRQHHRAHVQHAFAVHVVELESLDLRTVGERRVRRREP